MSRSWYDIIVPAQPCASLSLIYRDILVVHAPLGQRGWLLATDSKGCQGLIAFKFVLHITLHARARMNYYIILYYIILYCSQTRVSRHHLRNPIRSYCGVYSLPRGTYCFLCGVPISFIYLSLITYPPTTRIQISASNCVHTHLQIHAVTSSIYHLKTAAATRRPMKRPTVTVTALQAVVAASQI